MPSTTTLTITAPRSGAALLPDVKDHVEHLHTRAPFRASAVGGTTAAVTATVAPTFTAYATGMSFWIRFTSTPASGATLNINGKGAKALCRRDTAPIAAGDIQPGEYLVWYDGTRFLVMTISEVWAFRGVRAPQTTIVSNLSAAEGSKGTAASFGGTGSGEWRLESKRSLAALGKSTVYLCSIVRTR